MPDTLKNLRPLLCEFYIHYKIINFKGHFCAQQPIDRIIELYLNRSGHQKAVIQL